MLNATTSPIRLNHVPSDEEIAGMQAQLSGQFPHLEVAVELREGVLVVDAR